MTRAEKYRQRAKEVEEQANKTRDASAKEGFLEIARQWPSKQTSTAGRPPQLAARSGPVLG